MTPYRHGYRYRLRHFLKLNTLTPRPEFDPALDYVPEPTSAPHIELRTSIKSNIVIDQMMQRANRRSHVSENEELGMVRVELPNWE